MYAPSEPSPTSTWADAALDKISAHAATAMEATRRVIDRKAGTVSIQAFLQSAEERVEFGMVVLGGQEEGRNGFGGAEVELFSPYGEWCDDDAASVHFSTLIEVWNGPSGPIEC